MMKDVIAKFPEQFSWGPAIQNAGGFSMKRYTVLVGMGGSHLAADLMLTLDPNIPLNIHADYGLPPMQDPENTLVIACSYSGNTEETLSAYEAARERNIPILAISIGGELLSRAKRDGVPFIQIPDTGIQPRSALGFMFRALAKALGRDDLLRLSGELSVVDMIVLENRGREIAKFLEGGIPVVYASARNAGVAHTWKVKLNEGAKVPAFDNMFPELNHNEMEGFELSPKVAELARVLKVIILRDDEDSERIQRRMQITKELLLERRIDVFESNLSGSGRLQKIFGSLTIVDWAASALAEAYGVDPEAVRMVEDFKQRMRK